MRYIFLPIHYEQYRNRKEEMAHDSGWNNALDNVLRVLGERFIPWYEKGQDDYKTEK